MRITAIAFARYRIPFVAPYETAHGRVTHRVGYVVRALTNAGVEGLGEAALDPAAPESASNAIEPHLRALGLQVVQDAVRLDDAMEPYLHGDEAMRAANCAIETAIADAGSRWAGVPLLTMLSGRDPGTTGVTTVPVNATIAHRRTEEAAAAALLARASGFGTIKLKVGMESGTPSLSTGTGQGKGFTPEVTRVRTIREVIGPDMKLRLDANGAWDEAAAIETIRALEPFDIELIEQPVADIESLARVRGAVTMRIAADESVSDFAGAQRAIYAADVIVLKPMRLGGPTVARYLAQYANGSGLDVFVTTTIDTGIGTAMALQVAAALPDARLAHGLATTSLLESDLLAASLRIERGDMRLSDAPGLGVDLDPTAVAKYLGPWTEVHT
jgi:L-alanine-DL-glutamate epimerase-like enolase superfamily enzyme